MTLRDILKGLSGSRAALEQGVAGIDALREQIAEKKAEGRRIAEAAQPVTAALAAYDTWAANIATRAVDAVQVQTFLDPSESGRGLVLPPGLAEGGRIPTEAGPFAVLLGLIVAASGPALREVIRGHLEDRTEGMETLTDSTRAKKLVRHKVELLGLEMAEEAAIRSLEDVGIAILRRADADPAAVLAADGSLPG